MHDKNCDGKCKVIGGCFAWKGLTDWVCSCHANSGTKQGGDK